MIVLIYELDLAAIRRRSKGKLIAPQKKGFSLICVIIYTLLLISSSYEIRNKSKSCQTRDHQCQNTFAVTYVLKLFSLMI